jgi:hypothetical protein
MLMLMLISVSKAHAPPTWRARCWVSKPRHRGIAHPLVRSMMGHREACTEDVDVNTQAQTRRVLPKFGPRIA